MWSGSQILALQGAVVTAETPSRELLLKAFNLLRKADWGSDLDVALTHPVRGKIIIMRARAMLRGGYPSHDENHAKLPVKPGENHELKPLPLDRKRLASGEREDD